MNKERELLKQALAYLSGLPARSSVQDEIEAYLSNSDDAEEPVEFKFIPTGKELLRYHPDEDCIETKVEFANYPAGSKFYPPKPAESEAEPVAWIKRQYAGTGKVLTSIFYCPEPGAIPLYTKPAEPEAETIETLKAENFKLASGQCTEGGPWGDEGGSQYCKYARPEPEAEPFAWVDEERLKARQQGFSAIAVWFNPDEGDIPLYLHPPRPEPRRKPMTEEEIDESVGKASNFDFSTDFYEGFDAGIRYAEKHHGITDAEL